ncbi:MAG: Brp/Blh family beta-carotene 15,15'-dioxygenase [Acidobacteriota bacterium]
MPAPFTVTFASPASGNATPETGRVPKDWWRGHARLLTVLSGLAAAAVIAWGSPQLKTQLLLLAVGVAVLGVPHGALDHVIGRRLLRRPLGPYWAPAFFGTYLGLAALVLVAWWHWPIASLVAFLGISALHFGLGDVRRELSASTLFPLEVAARGALPLAAPMLFHPQEVAHLFGALVAGPGPTAEAVWRYAAIIAAMLAPALGWSLYHHARRTFARAPGPHGEVIAEVLGLLVLFWAAPPLIAFLLYFCGWHSARHTLETAEELMPGPLREGLSTFIRLAVPLTVATLALAAVAWMLLTTHGQGVDPALLQVVFIGLAALTVPHMMLCAAAQRLPEESPASVRS